VIGYGFMGIGGNMSDTVTLERPASPEPAPAKPFPGIWPSIGWIAAFLVFQIVAGIAALVAATVIDGGERELAEVISDLAAFAVPMIWSLVIGELLLLALLWLYLRKAGRIAAVHLDRWSRLPLWQTIVLAAVLLGSGYAANWAYGEYVIPGIEVQEELRALFAAIPQTLPNQILLFAAVAVIAPLLEEILFRGLLQNSLSKRLPVWAAIALSALVFGAMHMDFYAMPPLVLMGAIFGVIYHLTGSLRVTIVLHMINNGAALTLG
jgi:membrane protease YdiL (CAAX protease family)